MNKAMDIAKVEAEISQALANTAKLNAEAAKMIRERAWYPAVVIASTAAATAALLKLFT